MNNNYNDYNNSNNTSYNQIGGEPANVIMEQKNVIGIDDTFDSSAPEPKKKSRAFYMAIGIIAGLVLFGFIIYFNIVLKQSPSSKPTEPETQEKTSDDKISKNYQIIDTKITDNDILLEIKNNNDMIVQSELVVELYDAAKVVVDKLEFEPAIISKNSSTYETFVIDPSLNITSYKATTKLSEYKYKNNADKDIAISDVIRNDKKVTFNYMNNFDEPVNYIEFGVFLYDSSHKVIGYQKYVSTEEIKSEASSIAEVTVIALKPLKSTDSVTVDVKVLSALQLEN